MKEAFSSDAGYTLVFQDGQQKQTNQITAIYTFIQQDVPSVTVNDVVYEVTTP